MLYSYTGRIFHLDPVQLNLVHLWIILWTRVWFSDENCKLAFIVSSLSLLVCYFFRSHYTFSIILFASLLFGGTVYYKRVVPTPTLRKRNGCGMLQEVMKGVGLGPPNFCNNWKKCVYKKHTIKFCKSCSLQDLEPPQLVWHTWGCPCLSVVPEALSRGPFEVAVWAQKAPQAQVIIKARLLARRIL